MWGGAGDTALAFLLAGASQSILFRLSEAERALVGLKRAAAAALPLQSTRALLGLDAAGRRLWFYHSLRDDLSAEVRGFWDRREPALRRGLAWDGALERGFATWRAGPLRLLLPERERRRWWEAPSGVEGRDGLGRRARLAIRAAGELRAIPWESLVGVRPSASLAPGLARVLGRAEGPGPFLRPWLLGEPTPPTHDVPARSAGAFVKGRDLGAGLMVVGEGTQAAFEAFAPGSLAGIHLGPLERIVHADRAWLFTEAARVLAPGARLSGWQVGPSRWPELPPGLRPLAPLAEGLGPSSVPWLQGLCLWERKEDRR